MKVYVLTTGEYSDYTIHGIYSTMERAQEVHDLLVRQNFSYASPINDVFEWEVDAPALNNYWFRVFYHIDEDKIEAYLIGSNYRHNMPSYETYSKTFVYEIPYFPRLENEEILRKVTYDKWAQFKAEQMEF